ncbi:hypothetical protein ACFFNY_01020 [Paenibacillus hodogayensis]|uniref:Uncharacterized protein n=1 Tax=Paenibacillus hodogayensis TaxID=279208 RepID=A0ABV5VPR2_9BACL
MPFRREHAAIDCRWSGNTWAKGATLTAPGTPDTWASEGDL